jgi:hypothetical protein
MDRPQGTSARDVDGVLRMTILRNGLTAPAMLLACLVSACSSSDSRDDPWYNRTMAELATGSRPAQSAPVGSGAPVGAPIYAVARPDEANRAAIAELYRSDGSCGGMPLGPGTISTPMPPGVSGAISFDMSECDVVRRAGPPEKAEIGTNERGERNLTLTYSRPDRNNIYRFLAGRLVSVERGPTPPPAPAKPPVKRRAA